ncbi:MAG: hypothetical protein KAT58_11535, partial [candidate division Zixibacteria bacterium]|nr:hypothetical protein [candidate division Zixibacteria bacterium]
DWRNFLVVVVLVLLLAPGLFGITGIGIGLKAGIVSDYDAGVDFGYELPNLKLSDFEFDNLTYFGGFLKFGSRIIDLELGAEYFWDSKDISITGLGTKEFETKDFSIGATLKYYFDFPLLKPFIGGGVAMHNFTYKYEGDWAGYSGVTIVIPDDEAYFGYHLVVGGKLALKFLPFDLFVEGKIGKVNTKPDKTDFTVFAGGVTFNLP